MLDLLTDEFLAGALGFSAGCACGVITLLVVLLHYNHHEQKIARAIHRDVWRRVKRQ